jgi:hypothetical protein
MSFKINEKVKVTYRDRDWNGEIVAIKVNYFAKLYTHDLENDRSVPNDWNGYVIHYDDDRLNQDNTCNAIWSANEIESIENKYDINIDATFSDSIDLYIKGDNYEETLNFRIVKLAEKLGINTKYTLSDGIDLLSKIEIKIDDLLEIEHKYECLT